MKHITTSELQEQNKANRQYGYIMYCKGVLDVHAALQGWLWEVTAVFWEHRSSLALVSIADRRLAGRRARSDYSRPGWQGLLTQSLPH